MGQLSWICLLISAALRFKIHIIGEEPPVTLMEAILAASLMMSATTRCRNFSRLFVATTVTGIATIIKNSGCRRGVVVRIFSSACSYWLIATLAHSVMALKTEVKFQNKLGQAILPTTSRLW